MRYKLLIMLLVLPFIAKGQKGTIFYNKGKMYVGKTVSDATTKDVRLYVGGSMIFVDGSSVKQEGGTALTGDFISAVRASGEHVFTRADAGGTRVRVDNHAIYFVNTTDTLYNLAVAGDMDGSGDFDSYRLGNLDLSLKAKQYIRFYDPSKTPGVSLLPTKTSYIDMPTIVVGDGNYVAVDNNTSISVDRVKTMPGGLFSVEANYTAPKSGAYSRQISVGHVLPAAADRTAADFENMISIPSGGGGPTNPSMWKFGSNMLDLQLYDATNAATAKTSNGDGTGTITNLTGFTPPYVITGDYLFFHALTQPNQESVTSKRGPIYNPYARLMPGYGYFIAMNVDDHDYDDIENNPLWPYKKRLNRARGGYKFSRTFLNEQEFNLHPQPTTMLDYNAQKAGIQTERFIDAPYITQFASDSLKGSNKGLEIPLNTKYDFHFLGNPYTAPLHLDDLVATNIVANGGRDTDFGHVIVDYTASAGQAGMRNTYWLVNDAKIKSVVKNYGFGDKVYWQYKIGYFDAQEVGGTSSLNGNDDYSVAPMQMFCIQTNKKAQSFTFPFTKRHHTVVNMTKGAEKQPRKDELLIQILDLQSGQEDRTCMVLREDGSLAFADANDSSKGIKTSTENTSGQAATTKAGQTTEQDIMTGIIYTSSDSGQPMLTNVIPSNTKQLGLYFIPPVSDTREYALTPYRLNTMTTVDEVWIEDTYTNRFEKLENEQPFKFVADPLTGDETTKNRFILHFGKINDEIIDNSNSSSISIYYNSSTVYVSGLNNKDIGSDLVIYDMQGRLMGKTKITQLEEQDFKYFRPLNPGTYVAKIIGARNYASKFVSIRN